MVAIEILKIKKECSKVYICALTRMLCMYCHVSVYTDNLIISKVSL